MVFGGEQRLECEVCVYGISLEHLSGFKYLECVLSESGFDEVEWRRKVVSRMSVAGAIRFLLMLGACSFSMLGSWLFLCMVVRQ